MIIIEDIIVLIFFFQAEDGIRDLVRSRGLGDVYKRQVSVTATIDGRPQTVSSTTFRVRKLPDPTAFITYTCLLYTSDAADERSSVDLGGRRIIKKKKTSH